MNKTILVALRELKQRVNSRSFMAMAILGPIIVLAILFTLFKIGGSNKNHWNILISDRTQLLDEKIQANDDINITYSFIADYVQLEDFKTGKRFAEFDALLEVNEKMLSNKNAFVFYREKPSSLIEKRIHYQLERRVEELMVEQHTDLSIAQFRSLKNPLNLTFKNINDPYNSNLSLNGYAGFFIGLVVMVFIFLFGMTIFRSIAQEKSNRISEVLLGAIKARQLLFGKILGIGLVALIQIVLWSAFIGIGLFLMRETLFVDFTDPSKIDFSQMNAQNADYYKTLLESNAYNDFVSLVFERIQFSVMVPFTIIFALLGFVFYGGFFAVLGSSGGSENDGQVFLFPIIALMLLSIYAGYHSIEYPDLALSQFFAYLPFTAPLVCLVKLAQGYPAGTEYQLVLSIFVMVISCVFVLWLAGKIYKNGILQLGHRLRLKQLIAWFK